MNVCPVISDHRVGSPVGLVIIEKHPCAPGGRKSPTPFVDAWITTFVATIRREIKQVPDEFGPQKRPGLHLLPLGFMIKVLIFLRVIRTCVCRFSNGIFTVLVNVRTGSVFADPDAPRWIGGTEVVGPRPEVRQNTIIPL